jgi:hypothetical protein
MASCKNSSSMDAPARDENGAALLSSGATAALYGNDDAGAGAAYLYHPGATTTKGQDEHGAARGFSGSRPASATTLIDGGAADLFPDARTAAQTKVDDAACLYASVHADADASQVKNSAPTVLISDVGVRAADLFPDARTAAQTKADDAACLYPSVHDADADASQVKKNSAPTVLISDVGVRAAAQDEDAKVYLDFDTLAAAKNRHAAAAGQRGVRVTDPKPIACCLPACSVLALCFLVANLLKQEMLAGFRWRDDERPSRSRRRPGKARRSVR